MATLSHRELSDVVRIGTLSQECLSEEQFGQIMTEEMLRVFDSRSAVFLEFEDGDNGLRLGESVSYGIDNVHAIRYSERYHKLDPCYQGFLRRCDAGEFPAISTDQVVESETRYVNSEYYQDFIKPTKVHRSLIFGLGNTHKLNGLVGLHRRRHQASYSEADHLKIRLVAPYLSTAIMYRQKARLLHRQHALKELILRSSNVIGYLLLDASMMCLDAGGDLTAIPSLGDVVAESIVGEPMTSMLSESVIDYVESTLEGSNVADAQTETFDNLIVTGHARATIVHDENRQGLVLLTFLNPELQMTSKERMAFYMLTRRQQEVVHLVELGFTNPQIASTLRISAKTVQNHLTQIYEKTQTHNKTSLLRQLFI